MTKVGKWILMSCLMLLSLCSFSVQRAHSQARVDILETNVFYTFGGQVTFWARFQSEIAPQSVQVFYKSYGDLDTLVGDAQVYQDEIQYTLDLSSYPLRAFAEVEYYFGIYLPSETVVSPTFSFYYEDNRFDWQSLQNDPFLVHWYSGDLAFGQMVLDVAQMGLLKAQTTLKLPTPEKVDIFVYASGAEMQSTLRLGGIRMVAGHASPDLGVMMVSLPSGPEQRMETERQVPHELMHILLYQRLGKDTAKLPTWLNEGLASYNEMLANPDYHMALKDAVETDSILPINMLCQNFPTDASNNYKAYAQSDSFVRYVYKDYGSAGLESLLNSFANGLDCEKGTEQALGKNLEQLERQWWAASLNQNVLLKALGVITPWVAILLVSLFAPVFLSVNNLSVKNQSKK